MTLDWLICNAQKASHGSSFLWNELEWINFTGYVVKISKLHILGVSWLVEWKFGIYETINVTNFSLIITLQHFLKRIHVNSSSIILLFFLFQTPSSLWAVRNKTVRVYECIVEELKMSPRVFEPLKMTSIDNDKVCRIMCWT